MLSCRWWRTWYGLVRVEARVFEIQLSWYCIEDDDACNDKSNAAYYVGTKFSWDTLAPEMISGGERIWYQSIWNVPYLSYFAELNCKAKIQRIGTKSSQRFKENVHMLWKRSVHLKEEQKDASQVRNQSHLLSSRIWRSYHTILFLPLKPSNCGHWE